MAASFRAHSHACLPADCPPVGLGDAAPLPEVPPPPPIPGDDGEDPTRFHIKPDGGSMGCWAHLCEHESELRSCFCALFPDDPRCLEDPHFIPVDCASIPIPPEVFR